MLALPTVAVLYFHESWSVWFGIPTPDTGFLPQLPALVAYGTPFALGWILHRRVDRLETLARQWPVNLGLGVALTVTCLSIVGVAPDLAAPTALAGGATLRLAYAAAYVLAIWTWTFGLLGASVRLFSKETRGPPLPRRRLLLALPRASADRVRTAGAADERAAPLVDQVPGDSRRDDGGPPGELSLPRAARRCSASS